MPSPSFLLKHHEPQSSNAILLQPIIPIGIVAYAITLLLGNLCPNHCMLCRQNVAVLKYPYKVLYFYFGDGIFITDGDNFGYSSTMDIQMYLVGFVCWPVP